MFKILDEKMSSKSKTILKKFLALLLMLGVIFIVLNITEVNVYAATKASVCSDVKMGNKIICELRSSVMGITKDMQEVFGALWNVFMLVCAYQVCYILVKKDMGDWAKEFVEFATKYALVLMITFPSKVGIEVSIPYKIYLEVEELSMGLVLSGGNFADNSGFDPIIKAYLAVGEMFWDSDNKLKKADLTPSSCTDNNLAALFTKNPGSDVPILAQGDCIIQLMGNAASTKNPELLETLIASFESAGHGYGGLSKAVATAAINKSENPATADKDKLPADIKLKYISHVKKIDEIANYIPIFKKQVVLKTLDVGDSIEVFAAKVALKIATFVEDIYFKAAMIILYLCILAGLCLIGASFFLLTFTPMLVVPMGMIIYQMMWIAAPLEGRTAQLIKTYKDTILPYAIGPALFVFLSYFVVAVLKTLPNVMKSVDSGMPRFAIVIFVAVLVLIISIYGFKILSEVFKWSKDFMALNLTPLLNHAMKMGDFVGGMITGALKLGLMAVTGGAAVGLAGAGAVAGIAKVGGAQAGGGLLNGIGGFFRGLSNGLRPGQTGNVGNSPIRIAPVNPLLAGAGGGNVGPSGNGGGNSGPSGNASGNNAPAAAAPANVVNASIAPQRLAPQNSMDELNERMSNNSTELNDRRSTLTDEDLNAQVDAKNMTMKNLHVERIKIDNSIESLSKKRTKAEEQGNTQEAEALLAEIKSQKLLKDEKINQHQAASHEIRGLGAEQSERAALVTSIGNDTARLSSMQSLEKNVIKDGVLEAILQLLPQLVNAFQQNSQKPAGSANENIGPQKAQEIEGLGLNTVGATSPGVQSSLVIVPSNAPAAPAAPAPPPPPPPTPPTPPTPESIALAEMKRRQNERKEALALKMAQKKQIEDLIAQEEDEKAQEEAELAKNPLNIIKDSFKDISPIGSFGGMITSGAKGVVKDLAKSADHMVTTGGAGTRSKGFSEAASMKHKAYENELKKREERKNAEAEEASKDPALATIDADIAKMKIDMVREDRNERIQIAELQRNNRNEVSPAQFSPAPNQGEADINIRKSESSFEEAMSNSPGKEELLVLQELVNIDMKSYKKQAKELQDTIDKNLKTFMKREEYLKSREGQKRGIADNKWRDKEESEVKELKLKANIDELSSKLEVSHANITSLQLQAESVQKALKEVKGKKSEVETDTINPKND